MDLDHAQEVFKSFSVNGNIEITKLYDLGVLLGMNTSKNTIAKLVKYKNIDETLNFDTFIEFFEESKKPDIIKNSLKPYSRKFYNYMLNVEQNNNFCKEYPIPPELESTKIFQPQESQVFSLAQLGISHVLSSGGEKTLSLTNLNTGTYSTINLPGTAYSLHTNNFMQTDDSLPKNIVIGYASGSGNTLGLMHTPDSIIQPSEKLKLALPHDNRIKINDFKENSNVDDKALKQNPTIISLAGSTSACYSTEISLDDYLVISGYANGNVLIHDITSPDKPTCQLNPHNGTVYGVSFNCFDNLQRSFATCGADGNICIHDIRTQSLAQKSLVIEEACSNEIVRTVKYIQDNLILCSGDDYCPKTWDIRNISQGPYESYFGCARPVTSIATISDNQSSYQRSDWFVSSTDDGNIRLWSAFEKDKIKEALTKTQFSMNRANEVSKELQDEYDRIQSLQVSRKRIGGVQSMLRLSGCSGYSAIGLSAWMIEDTIRVVVGAEDMLIRVFDIPSSTYKAFRDYNIE